MNLERYGYLRGRTYKEYSFYSEGPKGRIRKVVRFVLYYTPDGPYYNLVLGDWIEDLNDIDVKSVTNNGDTEKVLATVAASSRFHGYLSKSNCTCYRKQPCENKALSNGHQ